MSQFNSQQPLSVAESLTSSDPSVLSETEASNPLFQRSYLSAYLLVLLSAITYGLQPFFAYFAYADGANPIGLLLIRFAMANGILFVWLKIMGMTLPRGRHFWQFLLIGVGYAGAALGYYSASQSTSVSLAVILMFSFPVFVSIYTVLVLKERMSGLRIICMILALVGVLLAAGRGLQGDIVGIGWALFAALSYGSAIIYGSHKASAQQPLAAAWVILLGGVLVFTGAALLSEVAFPQSILGWSAVSGLAVFATITPIACFISGSPTIGAANASTLSTIEPVVAITVAVLLIGESLPLSTLYGGGLVLLAAAVLARRS